MTDFLIAEAKRIRLRLLEALAREPRGSSTVMMLAQNLRVLGYRKSEDYLLNQLRWMESESMSVRLIDDCVVSLLNAGRQHLEGSKILVGIDTPREEA